MRILLIGGTGTISAAITRRLLEAGEELYLLNSSRTHSVVSNQLLQSLLLQSELLVKIPKHLEIDSVV